MTGPGLFVAVAIGLAGGLIGRLIAPGRWSTFAALVAGLLGAALAVPAAEALGWPARGALPLILAAAVGATGLLALAALFVRRRRGTPGRAPHSPRRRPDRRTRAWKG